MWLFHCDPMKNLGHEKSSPPNIACPQSISNMGVEEPSFYMIIWSFHRVSQLWVFEIPWIFERGTTILDDSILWLKSLYQVGNPSPILLVTQKTWNQGE